MSKQSIQQKHSRTAAQSNSSSLLMSRKPGGALMSMQSKLGNQQFGQLLQQMQSQGGQKKVDDAFKWTEVNQTAILKNAGPVGTGGANLRPAPLSKELTHWLPQNTRVQVLRRSSHQWLSVNVKDGDHAGSTGYIADWLVDWNPPDTDAILHTVGKFPGVQQLVENHQHFQPYDIRTGDDDRSLALALYIVNQEQGRNGIKLDQEKYAAAVKNTDWKDKADTYRGATRPFFQSVELVAGETIWLPGLEHIESLKKSGRIPSRAQWKNDAIAVTKGVAGFSVGVAEGFSQSIVDVFTGIADIAAVVGKLNKIVSVETLGSIKSLIEVFLKLSAVEKEKLAREVFSAVSKSFGESVDDFIAKLTADSPYKQWKFIGKLIGYLLAEVAVAIFTAGVVTALKWAGRFTGIGRKFQAVISAISGKITTALNSVKKRRKSKKLKEKYRRFKAEANAREELAELNRQKRKREWQRREGEKHQRGRQEHRDAKEKLQEKQPDHKSGNVYTSVTKQTSVLINGIRNGTLKLAQLSSSGPAWFRSLNLTQAITLEKLNRKSIPDMGFGCYIFTSLDGKVLYVGAAGVGKSSLLTRISKYIAKGANVEAKGLHRGAIEIRKLRKQLGDDKIKLQWVNEFGIQRNGKLEYFGVEDVRGLEASLIRQLKPSLNSRNEHNVWSFDGLGD